NTMLQLPKPFDARTQQLWNEIDQAAAWLNQQRNTLQQLPAEAMRNGVPWNPGAPNRDHRRQWQDNQLRPIQNRLTQLEDRLGLLSLEQERRNLRLFQEQLKNIERWVREETRWNLM